MAEFIDAYRERTGGPALGGKPVTRLTSLAFFFSSPLHAVVLYRLVAGSGCAPRPAFEEWGCGHSPAVLTSLRARWRWH